MGHALLICLAPHLFVREEDASGCCVLLEGSAELPQEAHAVGHLIGSFCVAYTTFWCTSICCMSQVSDKLQLKLFG